MAQETVVTARVDEIRDGIAYVTVIAEGKVSHASIEADKLAVYGIGENDRFEIRIADRELSFQLVPRRVLSAQEVADIRANLDKVLPDSLLDRIQEG